MSIRRRLISGGGVLLVGQILGQVCGFARNVIVARLLTPEDFGIAATLGIAMSVFEMISNLAVDRLLVQAEDGDNPVFQATAHSFQVMRGLSLAFVLFLLAWPFSRCFGIPQAMWAFQCIALLPLLRGFMHLDPKRLQRNYGFGADVVTEVIPQIVLMLAAWPITWWLQDYSAMLWLLVLQAVATLVMSHVVARRRYAWAWDRHFFDRMYAFGWPLLLNGLLMFLIFQGDRMIIGAAYDMANLGVYSAAFTITFVPSVMIAKVASSLLLPLLSGEQRDTQRFFEYYAVSVTALCAVGIAFSTGFLLLGQRVILWTYGEKYTSVETFIGWMATMQMIRVLRIGPTIASMAWGDTRTPLKANLWRISVLPIAIWIGVSGKPLTWIVLVGCFGEFLALLTMVWSLQALRGLAVGYTLRPTLIGAGAVVTAFSISLMSVPNYWWVLYPAAILLIVSAALVVMVYSCPLGWVQLSRLLRYRVPSEGSN